MDFVDLDRVLDEFEEEEKAALSIVPGEELKPSGYIEFLEKHENQEWKSLNTDVSKHKFNLEHSGYKETVNVSYDEPYTSLSSEQLDSHSSLSPVLGKADELVITGERARGLKDHVVARSKRGTIASRTIEIQTEPLSPNSEQELSSLPFPKSDIIVDGHIDSFSEEEDSSCKRSSEDQNNSPIYASMDSSSLFCSSSHNSSIISLNTNPSQKPVSKDSSSHHADGLLSHPPTSGSTQQVNDEELNEAEIDMYLNDFNDNDNLHVESNHSGTYDASDSNAYPGQSVSNVSSCQARLTPDDLHLGLSYTEMSSEEQLGIQNQCCIKDKISGSGFVATDGNINDLLQQDQHNAYDSLVLGKTEIEDILESKKKLFQTVCLSTDDFLKKGDNAVYEQMMFGKMEIESVLEDVMKIQLKRYNNEPGDFLKKGNNNWSTDMMQNNDHGVKFMNGICSEENLPSPSDYKENIETLCMKKGKRNSTQYTGVGARPKDPSVLRKNRPSSLLGLSKVNLDNMPSPDSNMDSNNSTLPHVKQDRETMSQNVMHNNSEISMTLNEEIQRAINDDSGDSSCTNTMPPAYYDSYGSASSWDGGEIHGKEESLDASSESIKRMSRPTSLNLPSRAELDLKGQDDREGEAEQVDMNKEGSSTTTVEDNQSEAVAGMAPETEEAASCQAVAEPPRQVAQRNLGEVAPFWVPDAEAEACMTCSVKFTLWKRRHHCRACGKVLCSQCCSQKSILRYLDNKEARVCVECYLDLNVAPAFESSPRSPNPNNPSEYCSKVPPNQQASRQGVPPTVLVPTGVLKSSGSNRRGGEPKQVMFSDGIRPGGDLTELDGADHNRSYRKSSRGARRSAQQTQNVVKKLRNDCLSRSPCLIPVDGLPPLFIMEGETGHVEMDEALNQLDYTADYRMEGGPSINFAVNKNLSVAVKVVNLDCCMNRVCWSYVSRGMSSVGQSEVVILLELTEEEAGAESIRPPRDIFLHYHFLYEEALKGFTIQDMGHTILHQSFLGSRDHGGFLYVQPTFQCLNKLSLPEAPFAFGVLLQKWESPWAKVFPIRLMLRLGAEFRYYPCPLVSVRNRKPVFYEIGHTIMNLLADFRNFQYSLSQIRGVSIHMQDKKTVISLPRNRYNDIMKVVRSSNEHVMAFGSSFSSLADSHLVCIQNEEGNYQTQAINIQNKPRQVTGASFVVFNGALKSSSGLTAKSSIVEDGVMIQMLPEAMAALKQSLKDMESHQVLCGPVDVCEPDEVLEIQWVDNDKAFNIGVKSFIDGTSLEGVESVSVKSTSDFVGEELAIRWTRVYFLKQDSSSVSHFDPVDLTRLTEEIAQACCTALVPHLKELSELGQVKIGLRVNLTRDAVGYEIGSKCQGLSEKMLSSLDTCLIPIIHQASEEGMTLELVFHILL